MQTPELEAKINSYDPELFEGEADAPAEPDMFDSLLEVCCHFLLNLITSLCVAA